MVGRFGGLAVGRFDSSRVVGGWRMMIILGMRMEDGGLRMKI